MATMIIGGIRAYLDPGEELPFFFHVKQIPCRVVKPKDPIPGDDSMKSDDFKYVVMNNDDVNELIGILKALNANPSIREATDGQYIRFGNRTEVITYYQKDRGIVNINSIDRQVGPIPPKPFTIKTLIQYLEYFERTIGPDVKVLMNSNDIFTIYKRPNEPYIHIDVGYHPKAQIAGPKGIK